MVYMVGEEFGSAEQVLFVTRDGRISDTLLNGLTDLIPPNAGSVEWHPSFSAAVHGGRLISSRPCGRPPEGSARTRQF